MPRFRSLAEDDVEDDYEDGDEGEEGGLTFGDGLNDTDGGNVFDDGSGDAYYNYVWSSETGAMTEQCGNWKVGAGKRDVLWLVMG